MFAAFTGSASCQLAGFEIAGSQLAGLEIASWQLALLAFIYGSAVMAIVIVALMKSARKRRVDAQKKR